MPISDVTGMVTGMAGECGTLISWAGSYLDPRPVSRVSFTCTVGTESDEV